MLRRHNRRKKKTTAAEDETPIIRLDEGWARVNEACVTPFLARIETVGEAEFEKRSIPQEQFSAAYNTIFNMCTQRPPNNFSDQLYAQYTRSLEKYHNENTIPSLRDAHSNPITFVGEWINRWRTCKWAVMGLKRVFQYLDRFYVRNEEGALELNAQGFKQFHKQVFEHYSKQVSEVLLDMIDNERDGQPIEVAVREAIWVFVELGHKLPNVGISLYKDHFQKRLIDSARKYYARVSAQWIAEDSCPDYMAKAERAVKNEEDRLKSYLHNTTSDALMRAVREELLVNHQDQLLAKDTGLAFLMQNERTLDLARMYRLFNATDGLAPVAKALRLHVEKLGLGIIAKSRERGRAGAAGQQMVAELIALHTNWMELVRVHFQSEAIFQKALKEAFESFVNSEYTVSKLLAEFINSVLSKGNKIVESEQKREQTIEHVVMLYGYIKDKDVFERDYQMFLSTRLLDNRSVSEEAEKSMIGKLKAECGYQWTSKLEAMFNDVKSSLELNTQFKQSPLAQSLGTDIEVTVCTQGSWPSWNTSKSVLMPRELERATDSFKQFYVHKNDSRRLMWTLVKGRADIQVYFTRETKKLLNVTTFQMCVLLLFNRKGMLSCKDIVDMTGISRSDLRAHLLSLAHPKVKILQKNPSNNTLEDSHKFRLNGGYKNQLYRIKVPYMANLQGQALNDRQRKEMQKQQRMQRRHMIDAAIVRIMKTRKKMQHTLLVAAVIEQLQRRFTPEGKNIKKRIEDLIEQEYLERDEDERGVYNYKA